MTTIRHSDEWIDLHKHLLQIQWALDTSLTLHRVRHMHTSFEDFYVQQFIHSEHFYNDPYWQAHFSKHLSLTTEEWRREYVNMGIYGNWPVDWCEPKFTR